MKKKYNIKLDGHGMFEQELCEYMLKNRGVEDANHFLNPVEEDLLPLNSLKRIRDAYGILDRLLLAKSVIKVVFDCDTDGVCSGTIMTRFLRNFTEKDNVLTYINNGKAHGLVGQDLDVITEGLSEGDCLIIVDSLDSNIEQYKKIKEMGIEIIVLDHHAIDPEIPYDDYVCLVSSQREYDNPALSGAGVVWKFCKYCDEQYLTDYADDLVDLAAIGILADVMDVSEKNYENRYIIKQGLMNQKNLAVKKILGGYEFNSKSVLFSIAPLINACTRCGDNQVVMKMFLSDDNKELLACKKQLESYRELQREELDRLMPDISRQIEDKNGKNVVILTIDTPYGIAGVIGNKILEEVNRPLIILSWEDETHVGGSIRSIGTEDFRSMINKFEYAVSNGHENAAGISIQKDKYDEFVEFIEEEVGKIELDTSAEIDVDAVLSATDVTSNLCRLVHDINFISGNGFKPLTFKVEGFSDYSVGSWSKGKHLVMSATESPLTFIEWNTSADFEKMEDHSLLGDEIVGYGELESGFVGRKFIMKLILNDYEVV